MEVQFDEGKVPESYEQVSTPMMAKSEGIELIMDHRGLAIFSMPWRIESGTWYQRLKDGRSGGCRTAYTEQ